MSETILVPVDGSDAADAALDFALERHPAAHLIVYHAVDHLDIATESEAEAVREEFLDRQVERSKEESAAMVAEARERVDETDAEVEYDAEVGPPTRRILDYVDRRDVDQVVIGSHGRSGVTRFLVGSVAERVVRRAPVPVTIVHDDAE